MKYKHLDLNQRYIIEKLFKEGKSRKFIADSIGFDKSTITRELNRNGNSRTGYNAKGAQASAKAAKFNRIDYKRKISGTLEIMVREKLSLGWSPELISKRLKIENKASVSHESIYRYIEFDKTVFGGKLYKCLRFSGRRKKRGKSHKWIKSSEEKKFIDQRPVEANERLRIGDWERDLIIGLRGKSALLTVVDRKSRLTIIEKVPSTLADEVGAITNNIFQKNPKLPLETMTNDNGVEFGKPTALEKMLGVPVYFTNPYHSWERGTNLIHG